jgi:hypothetical protein
VIKIKPNKIKKCNIIRLKETKVKTEVKFKELKNKLKNKLKKFKKDE